MGPIDFRVERNTESQWVPSTVWLLRSFKISFFMFSRKVWKRWSCFCRHNSNAS